MRFTMLRAGVTSRALLSLEIIAAGHRIMSNMKYFDDNSRHYCQVTSLRISRQNPQKIHNKYFVAKHVEHASLSITNVRRLHP